MARPITAINQQLAALGREERLVRDGKGYYYVSGAVRSSGLYVYSLTDLQMGVEYVEEVLSAEDGQPFRLFGPKPDSSPTGP